MNSKIEDISPEVRALYKLLRNRTEMYLYNYGHSSKNLMLFYNFIKGTMLNKTKSDKTIDLLDDIIVLLENWTTNIDKFTYIPDGFNEFVAEYYNVALNSQCYYSLILSNEIGEEKAFDKFWKLLDEYLIKLGYEPIPYENCECKYSRNDGIYSIVYKDIDKLAESYMRTFNREPWNDNWNKETAVRRLESMCNSYGFVGFALWQDDKPIGAVMGKLDIYYDGDYFQIIEFWIEPEFQHKGYGKMLMNKLTEELKNLKVLKIYLITLHNQSTKGFYEHFGFETDENLCIMNLFLNSK